MDKILPVFVFPCEVQTGVQTGVQILVQSGLLHLQVTGSTNNPAEGKLIITTITKYD